MRWYIDDQDLTVLTSWFVWEYLLIMVLVSLWPSAVKGENEGRGRVRRFSRLRGFLHVKPDDQGLTASTVWFV